MKNMIESVDFIWIELSVVVSFSLQFVILLIFQNALHINNFFIVIILKLDII